MCYWVGTKNVRDEILSRLQKEPDYELGQLFYNTFVADAQLPLLDYYVAIGKSGPQLNALTSEGTGNLLFKNMRWGMPWSYTDKKTGQIYSRELINSTCEKLFLIHHNQVFTHRCLIPIDGYYEFFHFAGEVYPYFIKPKEGLFYAGGVWSEQTDIESGEITVSFSIITTPPNTLTGRLHNNPKAPNGPRMLLLIPEERIEYFLDPNLTAKDLKNLFLPFSDNKMDAYPVSRFLRKEFGNKINTPEVRRKIDYPELFFA